MSTAFRRAPGTRSAGETCLASFALADPEAGCPAVAAGGDLGPVPVVFVFVAGANVEVDPAVGLLWLGASIHGKSL